MAVFAIVVTCWWFARLQLSRNRDRHPHRAKRARQVRQAVVNSGVIAAAFWLVIALVKASKDMSIEQGEEIGATAAPWPGHFLINGLLMVLGLTYVMLAICDFFFVQPRTKRRKRLRRPSGDAGAEQLETESGPEDLSSARA